MTVACKACGVTVTVMLGQGAEQAVNGITIVASSRPVASCACGHVTTLDVSKAAIDAFHARMPVAKASWRRGQTCSVCRAKLTLPARWTQLPVTVEQPLVCTVTCEVPAVRCPSCGVDQLPRYAKADLDLAVRRVLGA